MGRGALICCLFFGRDKHAFLCNRILFLTHNLGLNDGGRFFTSLCLSLFSSFSLSVTLANNPLVSKLLRQALGTQIAPDQANLFCKGDLFNHLIFFCGHLFIWFPRLRRTLRGYSNKAGESNR